VRCLTGDAVVQHAVQDVEQPEEARGGDTSGKQGARHGVTALLRACACESVAWLSGGDEAPLQTRATPSSTPAPTRPHPPQPLDHPHLSQPSAHGEQDGQPHQQVPRRPVRHQIAPGDGAGRQQHHHAQQRHARVGQGEGEVAGGALWVGVGR